MNENLLHSHIHLVLFTHATSTPIATLQFEFRTIGYNFLKIPDERI